MSKTKTYDWDKQIKKVTKYSNKLGYEICYKKLPQGISYIDFNIESIMINRNLTKERKLYTILHELGHHIIHNKKVKKYNKTLGYQYKKFSKRSIVYKITEIEEELEAWKQGYKLSKKLGLKINRSNFETYKASLISTYIVHYKRN